MCTIQRIHFKKNWEALLNIPLTAVVCEQEILYSNFTKPQSMRVLTESQSRVKQPGTGGRPVLDEFSEKVATTITRSQSYLLSEQKPEGYWVGELMVDSTLVSDMLAFHHWNRKVDPVWQRKAVNHISSMQLSDGGWNIYYGGPAEVNATIKAYLALKLAGVSVKDKRMLKAREVALRFGGVPRMNTFSKLYLCTHRPLSVGVCAHDSMRGAAPRQMVSCQLLGYEQLVASDAGAAGNHQSF